MTGRAKNQVFLAVMAVFWGVAAVMAAQTHGMAKDVVARAGETVRKLESKESASEWDRQFLAGLRDHLQHMERIASAKKRDVWLLWILASMVWIMLGASLWRRGPRTDSGRGASGESLSTTQHARPLASKVTRDQSLSG